MEIDNDPYGINNPYGMGNSHSNGVKEELPVERDWRDFPEIGPATQERPLDEDNDEGPPPFDYEVPLPPNAPIWPDRNGDFDDGTRIPIPEARAAIAGIRTYILYIK